MDVAAKLRAEGFKVTPQRLAIYQALLEYDKHPTAECVYRNLHPTYPTMSLATVYKTMDIFKQIGLVRILNVGDDSNRYDYDVAPHTHICCSVCGRIEDVYDVDLGKIYTKVKTSSGYEVTNDHISFKGICPQCLEQNKCLEHNKH